MARGMARIFFMRWAVAVGACGVLLLPVEAQSAAATNLLRRGEATSGTTDATATVSSCGIPEFAGSWEELPDYPLLIGEAQGGFIGDDLVIVGGFYSGFQTVSVTTYALNAADGSEWRRMDDIPFEEGLTHAAHSIHGNRMFICGGYIGGHPGPAAADCFVYDHSIAPGSGQQWSRLPSLPEPRAGGGMVYDTRYEALIFAGGAVRPDSDKPDSVDYDDTWMLPPDNPLYGWQAQTSIPHSANHLGFVTAMDSQGIPHHYFMGGQVGEDEQTQNLDQLFEYVALTDQWVGLDPMLIPRGHASSSTMPYGCGFLIAGGSINGQNGVKVKTDDVSYYDIASNQWMSVGTLETPLKTPVCGIYGNYLYCSTGYTERGHRRKLQLVTTTA